MKDKTKIKISLVLNVIITILTIVASIIMFTGFQFMEGEKVLESSKIRMFKFYTVDSNIFMGIVAFLFALKEIDLLKGKVKEIPIKMYVLKLIGTVGVTLTFLTVFAYLGPISEGGIASMLMNSNLFFHLIIPVLSIVSFRFFERTDKLTFKYTFLGIITFVLYSIFYVINVLIHTENGMVSTDYDWYWFVQGGIWQMAIVLPLMFLVTYLISLILWRGNRKKNRKE